MGFTRREFFQELGALGFAAAGAGIYFVGKEYRESQEALCDGERFVSEQSGYLAMIDLAHDEIIFVDKHNVPLLLEVELVNEEIDIDATAQPAYIVAINFSDAIPAMYKPHGVAITPPPKSWRTEMEHTLEAQPINEGRQVARSHSVALVFKAAFRYTDEPDNALVVGIEQGKIRTFADIIDYYADKPVEGVSRKSRLEYVQENIKFKDAIPVAVQSALRELVPGVCAQESKFRNGMTSKAGAQGIFQFMPWVREHYKLSESELTSLVRQVEVAGEIFSDIYSELITLCDTNALTLARSAFASQDEYLQSFIVPLIINSYNAGSNRVSQAVNEYFKHHTAIPKTAGMDLFLEVADFAQQSKHDTLQKYKKHSREYVSRVYAHAVAIRARRTKQ